MVRRILIISFLIANQIANSQTVGLTKYSDSTKIDYVLFSPVPSTNTYLINKCGELVNQWTSSYNPGMSVYLLPNGNLLRPGRLNNSLFSNAAGRGGIIEIYDWNGTLVWDYTISNAVEFQHHDVEYLPNGHILAIVWDKKTMLEADLAGRDTTTVNGSFWSEKIIEIQPNYTNNTGVIVWEWKLWDHLIQDNDNTKNNFGSVSDFPELMDVNFPVAAQLTSDWAHLNGVDYNAALDQILISAHNMSEFWVIDHSTTTAQAATHTGGNSGKGGDFLYRWGNSFAYQRGTSADQKLFKQHNANWIEDSLTEGGKIIVFNNQIGKGAAGGDYSSVDIIAPPVDVNGIYTIAVGQPFAPVIQDWSYTSNPKSDFYSSNISGATRFDNGHTLVCEGTSGHFFELDQNDTIVWDYINPMSSSGMMSQGDSPQNNAVFRCTNYPSNYSGIIGSPSSQGPLELNPTPSICTATYVDNVAEFNSFLVYPNPVKDKLTLSGDDARFEITLFNSLGQVVYQKSFFKTHTINVSRFPKGIYVLNIIAEGQSSTKKVIIE